jgi:diguanylate cyclase (GGDEF)-like protein/PAS domain S-box-containing protein
MSQWVLTAIVALIGLIVGALLSWWLCLRPSGQMVNEKSAARRPRQSALSESEARYRLLAENAKDVIWTVDWPDLQYSYISPSIKRLRGISVQTAMSESLVESVVPEQRDSIQRMIDQRVQAFKDGRIEPSEAQRIQVRQHCADDSEKTVEIIASLSVDDEGEVVGIQGISRDVTARVRAEQDSKAREAILHALASAARMIFSSTDKQEVMEPALAELGQAVEVDRVYVFENHRDRRSGELLASQRFEWCGPGIKSELGNPEMQGMSYDQVIPNWRSKLESGEIVHGLVDEMPEPERTLLLPQNIQSILVVPIFLNGTFWGQIGFDDCSRQREWSQPEIDALEIAAGVIGGAINSIRVEEELRRLVSTDSLTGVSSRRAFLEQAESMFEKLAPRREDLALFLMDLDHFKEINDNHGHPAGDEALREFARICSRTLRPDDLIGRTGGEEFGVALKTTDHEQAAKLAEKLRKSVSRQPIRVDSMELQLTVSIGVAVAGSDEDEFSGLLKRADDALYSAKRAGRNRVELADQD